MFFVLPVPAHPSRFQLLCFYWPWLPYHFFALTTLIKVNVTHVERFSWLYMGLECADLFHASHTQQEGGEALRMICELFEGLWNVVFASNECTWMMMFWSVFVDRKCELQAICSPQRQWGGKPLWTHFVTDTEKCAHRVTWKYSSVAAPRRSHGRVCLSETRIEMETRSYSRWQVTELHTCCTHVFSGGQWVGGPCKYGPTVDINTDLGIARVS